MLGLSVIDTGAEKLWKSFHFMLAPDQISDLPPQPGYAELPINHLRCWLNRFDILVVG